MVIGFIIWSMVAAIFLGIGISCRKSNQAVGFFTFVKPPSVENVDQYNHAVSILWFVFAGILEMIGIPLLFLRQDSPFFILMGFAVVLLVIAVILAYLKIEAKYKK